jgi:hypothetical protein
MFALPIKIAGFLKSKSIFYMLKTANLNWLYKEVNCTDPSHSIRVPCLWCPQRGLNFQVRNARCTQIGWKRLKMTNTLAY